MTCIIQKKTNKSYYAAIYNVSFNKSFEKKLHFLFKIGFTMAYITSE